MPENSKQRNDGSMQESYPRKGGYPRPKPAPSKQWKPPANTKTPQPKQK